ncbi:hypothetical protein ACFL35_04865 [Candidatus Riflebacteria bacterium]
MSKEKTGFEKISGAVRIIFLATRLSIFMLVFVGYLVIETPEAVTQGISTEHLIMISIFSMLALSNTIVPIMLKKVFLSKLLKEEKEPAKLLQSWQVHHIIYFALAESIAIFGFVLGFLVHRKLIPIVFGIWAIIVFQIMCPDYAALKNRYAELLSENGSAAEESFD